MSKIKSLKIGDYNCSVYSVSTSFGVLFQAVIDGEPAMKEVAFQTEGEAVGDLTQQIEKWG
jgi:hypothetical protein